MKRGNNKPNDSAAMRRKAEAELKKCAPEAVASGADHETLRLIHELQVHQIELEMQNHQLLHAEEDLELSRNSYVELFDFAPVSYFIFDAQGLIQEVNLAGAQLLGRERQLLVNESFSSFIADAGERETFLNHLGLVIQRKVKLRCEIRLMNRDGVVCHVQLHSLPKEKIGDQASYIATTIIDITERRRAEEKLRDSERLYRAIGESIDYGIWICAPDGRNLYASDSFLKLVGITQEQCSNFGWGELLHPDDAERTIAAWKECVRTGGVWDMEHRFRGTDGKWHPILARGVAVRNDHGEIIKWVGINLDISRLKDAEVALQKAHRDLEQKVMERTKELTSANLQLRQEIVERKKAEESLQSAYAEIRILKDKLLAENIYLQQEIGQKHNFEDIIGQSNALTNILYSVEQVAPMNATVLLLGETGTGKGMIARAIHNRSARNNRPMITVNCTSLPANLIESELFGRERGAYTGADTRQIGRFELANDGTLFLDEIGEMPMELQSKLLRIIQDGEFERLGSPRTIKVDVRIIAATHRNLEDEVRAGRFREDLFYRLNVFPITIPPLRQRKEDIPLLVKHFIDKYNKKNNKKIETVSKDMLSALQKYNWPGNVRELESVVERAIITSQGSVLQTLDRFDTLTKTFTQEEGDIKALADLEQNHILQVLLKTGWRIEGKSGAAVLLGLNPSTLRARMRKYGIRRQ